MTLLPLIVQAAEGAGEPNVMLETIWYPIIALCVFFLLAMVTLSYRNVSNRHSHKADAYAREHADDPTVGGPGH